MTEVTHPTFAIGDTVKTNLKMNARPGFRIIKRGTRGVVENITPAPYLCVPFIAHVRLTGHGVQEFRVDCFDKVN